MTWKLTFSTLALALMVACSDSKGLSVRAKTADATGSTGSTGAASALVIDHGITLDRVRLVVREVEVEPETCTPTDPTGGTGGTGGTGMVAPLHDGADDGDVDGDDEGCELKFGPFLVDLAGDALADGIHYQFDVPVPAGTYEEVEFKINTINENKAGGDAGLAEMAARHASILIEGTLATGETFTYAVPFEVEQERKGVIVVDEETGGGVTLEIDPTGWFTGPGGAFLDPADPVNEGAIRHNIRASIRVEHDDDGDGCDDDDDASCDDHSGTGGSGDS